MEIPLLDEIDIEILKHRDAHFGGNFGVMLEYYEGEGIGAMADFEMERIQELMAIQEELGENLSIKFLTLPILEEVARAKELYINLRDLYEHSESPIADLILSEDEEAEAEIEAVIARGEAVVEPLINLINSAELYNPLYPGYGRAPLLAAICLARIGDPKAIVPLFNALGGENLDVEEAILVALSSFGQPAQNFLLERLKSLPVTRDNLNAALALTLFPPDEDIQEVARTLLKDPKIAQNESFAPYLSCLLP